MGWRSVSLSNIDTRGIEESFTGFAYYDAGLNGSTEEFTGYRLYVPTPTVKYIGINTVLGYVLYLEDTNAVINLTPGLWATFSYKRTFPLHTFTADWSKYKLLENDLNDGKYYVEYKRMAITYKISFYDESILKKSTDIYPTQSTNLPYVYRRGHEVSRWLIISGSGTINNNTFILQGVTDATLRVSWSIINYTIDYNMNGGIGTNTNLTSYNIESNTILLSPLGVSRIGYTFSRFYNMSNDETVVEISKGSTGNMYIGFGWTPVDYSITYNLQSGSGSHNNPTIYNIETPNITLGQGNIYRSGYRFDGWYTASSGGSRVTSINTGSTGNITLYARWRLDTYTIYWSTSRGSLSFYSRTETYGNYPTQPTAYAPAGYAFNGWSPSVNTVTGSRTYNATWIPITYYITYDLQGGTGVHGNRASYNIETSTFNLSQGSMIRNGYTFAGWYTSAEGGDLVTNISQGSAGCRTLYARWNIVTYSITYDYDGASEPSNPTSYNINTDTITFLSPSKTGFSFYGYYNSKTGGTLVNSIPKGSTGNIMLYARFGEIRYNVQFRNKYIKEDNTVVDELKQTIQLTYNTPILASMYTIDKPTKNVERYIRYNFIGWNRNYESTNPLTDLGLTSTNESNNIFYAIYSSRPLSIEKGNKAINEIKLGNSDITEVYRGSTLIWKK